jgi:hypothetical protein
MGDPRFGLTPQGMSALFDVGQPRMLKNDAIEKIEAVLLFFVGDICHFSIPLFD